MFIGHYAVAFAARKAVPAVSLGTLFLAVQLADLVWPVLVLAGVERFEIRPGITALTPLDFVHYPYSHSLAALAAWGAALGVGYMVARKAGVRTALLLAALVLSHWVLDFVTHRPDMPLTLGDSPKIGLGLWNSIAGTVAVEGALFAACAVANFMGPPPPSVNAVAWSANALWLVVAWGYWIDRHRRMAP